MLRTKLNDFEQIANDLHIEAGDVVVLHSALYRFGVLSCTPEEIILMLREKVGDSGALIIPTFTYSFRRNEVFDVRKSQPDKKLGLLAKAALQMSPVRSSCPLFSFAGFGAKARSLLHLDAHNCFGEQSVFSSLDDIGAKIVSIGVGYSTGISMFMHFEKLANVPYRKELVLHGELIDVNGEAKQTRAVHFARDEENYPGARTNRSEIGEYLENEGHSRVVMFNGVKCFAMQCPFWGVAVLEQLKIDPLCMLEAKL